MNEPVFHKQIVCPACNGTGLLVTDMEAKQQEPPVQMKCRCHINAKYKSDTAWRTGKLPKPCPVHPWKTGHAPEPQPMPLIDVTELSNVKRYLRREAKACKENIESPLSYDKARKATEIASAAHISAQEAAREQRDADMLVLQTYKERIRKAVEAMSMIEMKFGNVLDPDGFYHDAAYTQLAACKAAILAALEGR